MPNSKKILTNNDKTIEKIQYSTQNDVLWMLFNSARSAAYNTPKKQIFGIDVELLHEIRDIESFNYSNLSLPFHYIATYFRFLLRNTDRPLFAKDPEAFEDFIQRSWLAYAQHGIDDLTKNPKFAVAVLLAIIHADTPKGEGAQLQLLKVLEQRYGKALRL